MGSAGCPRSTATSLRRSALPATRSATSTSTLPRSVRKKASCACSWPSYGRGCTASCSTGWARPCHRLESSCSRQCIVCSEKGGEATGPNPTDRGRLGSKRHLLVGRQRDSTRSPPHGGEPTRQQVPRAADRGGAAGPAVHRQTEEIAGQAARRQGLRFRLLPQSPEQTGHHAQDQGTGSRAARSLAGTGG